MTTSVREPRTEKVAVVDEVRERLSESSAAILTEYRGLRVADLEELRRALTAAGGDYKVFKNTLVRRAAHEVGLGVLEPLLVGPTAIAFVRDDVAAVAKVLRDFARTHPNLVVKGGLLGANVLDDKATVALADLPSREVLLAQVAGALAAPMQRFAALLQALPQNLAYGIAALRDERLAAGGQAAAAESPVAEHAESSAESPVAEHAESSAESPAAEQAEDAEVEASGAETADAADES